MTLKAAMAERGLTAADLGAFFGVTEAHARRWMNHQNKVHFRKLHNLRTEFLRMGVDEFAPIREELTGVQYDRAADYRRWKTEQKLYGKPRRIIYTYCYTFGLAPDEFNMINALGGGSGKYASVYRKIIDFAIHRHASRIRSMKRLIGMSLEELTKVRENSVRGPIRTVVNMKPKQYENLTWLALSNGLTIEQTLKNYIREYYKFMKEKYEH